MMQQHQQQHLFEQFLLLLHLMPLLNYSLVTSDSSVFFPVWRCIICQCAVLAFVVVVVVIFLLYSILSVDRKAIGVLTLNFLKK